MKKKLYNKTVGLVGMLAIAALVVALSLIHI